MKLDVKCYVEKEKIKLKEKFRSIEKPRLWILTDHSSVAAESYMRSKIKVGQDVGVCVEVKDISDLNMLSDVMLEAQDKSIPTILQLPCDPIIKSIYETKKPKTDVDGFFAFESIYKNNILEIIPATPKGIVSYISSRCATSDLKNKNIVILGRGELVGKPLTNMLIGSCASISVITSKTNYDTKVSLLKNANVIILATGNDESLMDISLDNAEIVIDCGVFRDSNGKLYGEFSKYINKYPEITEDVDYTPVPGGVGLLTTLSLFDNIYQYYNKGENCNDSD